MSVKVTVLMPAYNAGKYIAESIQSVIDQTYSDWELLIMNDGSTDGTVQVVRRFDDPRIRLIENPTNLGLIKTLNHGLAEAGGEWIARLDSDDIAMPNRLELQVAYLSENPDCVLVGGRSDIIDENGMLKKSGEFEYIVCEPDALRWAHLFYNPFRHSAVTFRRDVIQALGGYPSGAKNLEDFALWSHLVAHHKTANLQEVICGYRVHSDSVLAHARKARNEVADPRRVIAAPFFIDNALAVGLSRAEAEEWTELWCTVRFQSVQETYKYGRMLYFLRRIVALAPEDSAVKEVICSAYAMLANRAKSRKQSMRYIRVSLSAILNCGFAYIAFMRDQYQRSRKTRR